MLLHGDWTKLPLTHICNALPLQAQRGPPHNTMAATQIVRDDYSGSILDSSHRSPYHRRMRGVIVALLAIVAEGCGDGSTSPIDAQQMDDGGVGSDLAGSDAGCGPSCGTPLATGLLKPGAIAQDSQSVYLTQMGAGAGCSPMPLCAAMVIKAPKSGGAGTPLVLASTASPRAHALVVTSAYIYWVNEGDDQIMRSALDGSGAMAIATAQSNAIGIAADAAAVYWTIGSAPGVNNGSVIKSGPAGESPTPIVTGQASPDAIAIDAQNIYWTNRFGKVMKANRDGTAPTAISTTIQTLAWSIAIDSNNVYWTSLGNGAGSGEVRTATKTGMNEVALGQGRSGPVAVSVDAAGAVYWADSGVAGGDGAILKATTSPTSPVTVAAIQAPAQAGPSGLVVDGTEIYFTVLGTGNDGQLLKVQK